MRWERVFQTTELGKWSLFLNPPKSLFLTLKMTPKTHKERRKTEDMDSFLSNEEAEPLILTDCLCLLPSPPAPPLSFFPIVDVLRPL